MHTGFADNNQTYMDQIIDSDDQMDDYFNVEKNPFEQRGFGAGNHSMDETLGMIRPTVVPQEERALTSAAMRKQRDPFGGAAGDMDFGSRSSDEI